VERGERGEDGGGERGVERGERGEDGGEERGEERGERGEDGGEKIKLPCNPKTHHLGNDRERNEEMSNTYADNHALPCPFCGGGAKTDFMIEDIGRQWWCECGGKTCLVIPSTQDKFDTEAEAVRVWNERK
jgi:Restriction alleviation protein Lar